MNGVDSVRESVLRRQWNRCRKTWMRPAEPFPVSSPRLTKSALLWWISAASLLLLIGLGLRVMPLFLGGDLIFRQFMTEDGYLMLTVARNIALGKGMTIADGAIPTNGVQPLATFLYAACFWLADGDRMTGLVYVHILSIAAAVASAGLIFLLARAMISEPREGWIIGLLAAGIWFSAPLVLQHSMNGLETGLYFISIAGLGILLIYWANGPAELWTTRRLLGWGFLVGVAFWIRNDAVFFMLAFCLVWLFTGLGQNGIFARHRIREISIAGTAALLMATPWLIYNYTLFGSIVPISGLAESHGVSFGQHAYLAPVKLAEHIMFLLPVPSDLEKSTLIILSSLLVVGGLLVGTAVAYRSSAFPVRTVILTFTVFGIVLTVYYGLFFGAPHFLSRYLSVLTPIIAVASSAGLLIAGRGLVRLGWPIGVPAIAVTLVALGFGLNLRLALQAHQHEHFQVVEWVEENVSEEKWIGAIQTGTVGFFHERTINLDGKVNPLALEARKKDAVLQYIVESEIEYLVDWVGITSWVTADRRWFGEYFEVLVSDPRKNLGVLRRVKTSGH